MFTAAIVGVCITILSLVANLALWQWGSDKSDRVDELSEQSACRSTIAAETDVAQGRFLADLGATQLATARGLAAVGTDDEPALAAMVSSLLLTSDALEKTLGTYLVQLDARSRTLQICGG